MKSTVEELEDNKVRVSVTVPEAELEPALNAAWAAIAREVRIPGFRNGKAPRKVLEKRIEPGYARSEAIRQAVPEFYLDAVVEHDLDVVAQPELDVTGGEEVGDIAFAATVEVRQRVVVGGYRSIVVTIPSLQPSDDEVADQIDRLRQQSGTLEPVERAAAHDDFVTIDLSATRDGEPIDALTVDGFSYRVGSGLVVPELDETLAGMTAGDTVSFEAPHPGEADTGATGTDESGTDESGADESGNGSDDEEAEAQPPTPVSYSVTLVEVKERKLPELTDEWVADVSEFETVDELRDDVLDRLTEARRSQAGSAAQSALGSELAQLVTDEVSDTLVGLEMRNRLEDMAGRLQSQGLTIETYLQVTGTSPEQFTDDLKSAAVDAVKVDLALRAIVDAESLEPTEDEVGDEIRHLAFHLELPPDRVRSNIEENRSMSTLRSDLARRKALKWLFGEVEVRDENGMVVPIESLDLDFGEHDHGDDHEADDDHDHPSHDD